MADPPPPDVEVGYDEYYDSDDNPSLPLPSPHFNIVHEIKELEYANAVAVIPNTNLALVGSYDECSEDYVVKLDVRSGEIVERKGLGDIQGVFKLVVSANGLFFFVVEGERNNAVRSERAVRTPAGATTS